MLLHTNLTPVESAQKTKKKPVGIIISVIAVVLVIAVGIGFMTLPIGKYYSAVLCTKFGMEEKAMQVVNKLGDRYKKDFLIVYEKETLISDSTTVNCEYVFDENGNMLEEKYEGSVVDVQKCVYEYDTYGNITSAKCFTADGELNGTVENEVDKKGRLVKKVISQDNGDKNTVTYKYDAKGNVIEESSEYDGRTESITYEYDNKNNLVKSTFGSDNGYGSRYEDTYEYSSDGKLIKSIYTQKEGYTCTYEYKYDNNGYLIEEKRVDSDEIVQICSYLNDKNGNPVEKTYQYDGELSTQYKYSDYRIFYRPGHNNEFETMY